MARLSSMLVLSWSFLPLAAFGTGLENGDAGIGCMTYGTCDVSLDETSAMQIRKGRVGLGQSNTSNLCLGPVKFFDPDKVQDEVPLPPSTHPEELHGLNWMDQHGAYGFADVATPAPDIVMSFADPIKKWSPEEKTISIAPWGRTWTWLNTPEGHATWGAAKFVHYIYSFKFNEDLSYAQILIEVTLGPFGTWTLPDWLVNATMQKQPPPPPGACPPPPQATKEQKSQCATWHRRTTVLPGWPLLEQPMHTYHIFKIMDNKGDKIQPYYDAYVEFASTADNNQTDPDSAKEWLGVDLEEAGGTKPGQSFVGTHSSTAPGLDLCVPQSPCQSLSTPSAFAECLAATLRNWNAFG